MRFVSVRPYAALAVLALIAFWPLVLHPTETLYSNHSDLLAQHIPAKYFLVRSLRETGELPLWNPEQYAGSPFVHDIQVGLFYPPNLPLYFISEPAIGPFVSWLVFVHVLLAGWFMYAYSRHAGLGELAAFVAGVGYMLSPRWMLQLFEAGHTVTQGICWLPLILLCVERAIIRKRWSWAIGGGVAYALLILGTHPQWTLYASLLIGFWPLRILSPPLRFREGVGGRGRAEPGQAADYSEAPHSPSPLASGGEGRGEGGCDSPGEGTASASGEPQPPSPPTPLPPKRVERGEKAKLLLRWLLAEAIVVTIGLALCAVQLLPTMEAAGESSRARGMGQSWSLDGAKAAATTLIGPIPDRQIEPIHWETRGCIGFTWAVMAIVGARLGGRRALVPTLIALGMLAYALGGSYFIDWLPGFNNFRMPTRMLLTLAFPVAFLAGLGVQSLGHERAKSMLRLATSFWIIVFVNLGTVAFLAHPFLDMNVLIANWWVYWIVVFAGWALFLFVAFNWPAKNRAIAATLLLIADVLIVTTPHARTRPSTIIYPRSPVIDYLREHNSDGHRVYDVGPEMVPWQCFFGPGSPAASVFGVPSIRGYNPLDVARYRQLLAAIAGESESETAFGSRFTHPIVGEIEIHNRRLLDLVGVKYLVVQAHPLHEQQVDVVFRAQNVSSYDCLGQGNRPIGGQSVIENTAVMPRAFVSADLVLQTPGADILAQLVKTDIRRRVIVEDFPAINDPQLTQQNSPGPATIRSHKPNEIIIDLDGKTAGLLVLTDPWYPGWVCRVDGQEVPIWKADYAFRGVMVPEGSREVVFHFEPQSYRRGKWISIGALFLVGLLLISDYLTQRRRGAE